MQMDLNAPITPIEPKPTPKEESPRDSEEKVDIPFILYSRLASTNYAIGILKKTSQPCIEQCKR